MKSHEKPYNTASLKEQKTTLTVQKDANETPIDVLLNGIRGSIQDTLEKRAKRRGRHKR